MKSTASLSARTVEEIVALFREVTLAQDVAIRGLENIKYRRLYQRMNAIRSELRSRPGDGRWALRPLLDDENDQVRLMAASTMIPVDEKLARTTLSDIAATAAPEQSYRAQGLLDALDAGTFKPSY